MIPRKQIIHKTRQDQLIDEKTNYREDDRLESMGIYQYYSIKLGHLVIPEALNKVNLRKQHKKDQTIFKFI